MKRLGLLVPSTDTTIEYEFSRYLPPYVSLHISRMPLTAITPGGLFLMKKKSEQAALLLKEIKPNLILYGCTSGSFLGGKEYDKLIEKELTDLTKAPIITTAHAVIKFLKVLKAQKIIIITPYIKEINQAEKNFFNDHGFTVNNIYGMNMTKDVNVGKLSDEKIYQFAVEHDDPKADLMFISCTNLKTLKIISSLKKKLRKPIVSSNLASLWAVCKFLNVKLDMSMFGLSAFR